MTISKAEIESYIPQRPPFIMIDALVHATSNKFETNFAILPGNIFVEDGILREFALIENIAQSSAAGLAVFKRSLGEKLVDGFIGGVSKLKLHELPKVGDTVYTTVCLLAEIKNMFLLKGETFVNGRKLLECELKLVGVKKEEH